jgi:hypothetical protein
MNEHPVLGRVVRGCHSPMIDRQRTVVAARLTVFPARPDATVDAAGPFHPYFEVVRAVEHESLFDIREAADRPLISVAEINRADLRALAIAAQLE